ncbi:hypothetical protein KIPB_001102 [Kipferlia bialata]|uniref:PDEase domain-containing protein n=1 Tax=Kipferlia bialata TaxID=797122 RepID=A0A9K3GF09_9EUKA|nr:hypothetical protein KIPB_001102 [Kipferlia bialata]|eukprot:g1102.t1
MFIVICHPSVDGDGVNLLAEAPPPTLSPSPETVGVELSEPENSESFHDALFAPTENRDTDQVTMRFVRGVDEALSSLSEPESESDSLTEKVYNGDPFYEPGYPGGGTRPLKQSDVSFDAHAFENILGPGAYIVLFLYWFVSHKIHLLTSVPSKDMMKYLLAVYKMTLDCPFSNRIHTLDALQMAIVTSASFQSNPHSARLMPPIVRFILLLAVVSRNIDRPGISLDYAHNTWNSVVVMHGPVAPFEKQACLVALHLLTHTGILGHMRRGSTILFREAVVATNSRNIQPLRYIVRRRTFSVPYREFGTTDLVPSALLRPDSDLGRTQTLILKVLALTASIGNAARPWQTTQRFGRNRTRQSFGSGCLESEAGLVVPPRRCMDRDPEFICSTCQLEFCRERVVPFLDAVQGMAMRHRLVCLERTFAVLLRQARRNQSHWEECQ